MAFAIKGQTKAAAAFKGNFAIYGPILFKLCVQTTLPTKSKKSDYSKAMNGISMDEIKNIVNATGKQDPWKNKRPSRKRAGEIIVAFITKCHHDMDENNQTCPDYNPRIRNLIN